MGIIDVSSLFCLFFTLLFLTYSPLSYFDNPSDVIYQSSEPLNSFFLRRVRYT